MNEPTLSFEKPPFVLVAAVALVDESGRVLLAERPIGKAMAGLWEFPGGKVKANETVEGGLCRELHEELDIEVVFDDLEPVSFASHDYGSFRLFMPLFICRTWKGNPKSNEDQKLAWVLKRNLHEYAMPAADIGLVAALKRMLAGD